MASSSMPCQAEDSLCVGLVGAGLAQEVRRLPLGARRISAIWRLQPERFLFGTRCGLSSEAPLWLPAVELEVEIEQFLEKIAGRPAPIVERDRFFADQQCGVGETRVGRPCRLLEVRVERIRLHDSRHEPAVRRRACLERNFLVPNPLAAR